MIQQYRYQLSETITVCFVDVKLMPIYRYQFNADSMPIIVKKKKKKIMNVTFASSDFTAGFAPGIHDTSVKSSLKSLRHSVHGTNVVLSILQGFAIKSRTRE